MSILVSGLINIETTLHVEGFPIEYAPVRYPFFGVRSTVSGVGYNISKALTTLGDPVQFLSLIGADANGDLVRATLAADGIPTGDVLPFLEQTAQSVILYDGNGKRQINVDLKDIQDIAFPEERADHALAACSLAVLGNINFSRPLLERARELGKPIATDVHTIADLDDDYNRDFMQSADILFMSGEMLPTTPEIWAQAVIARYGNAVVVIGLGAEGALLAVRDDDFVGRFPAVQIRPVVNTIGAGDALFSAFVHAYTRTSDPYHAMRQAIVFAAYKIGVSGAADGFLDAEALDAWTRQLSRAQP